MFYIKNTSINRSVVGEKHNVHALYVQRGATCSPITFSPWTEEGPLPDPEPVTVLASGPRQQEQAAPRAGSGGAGRRSQADPAEVASPLPPPSLA